MTGDEAREAVHFACCEGDFDLVETLIAHGGEGIDLEVKDELQSLSYIDVAQLRGHFHVAALLRYYKADKEQAIYDIKADLNFPETLHSELYAQIIFISDGVLRINGQLGLTPEGRFFSIASRLPMELQMILCHRVFGSVKNNIPSRDSERAFKHLAPLILSDDKGIVLLLLLLFLPSKSLLFISNLILLCCSFLK